MNNLKARAELIRNNYWATKTPRMASNKLHSSPKTIAEAHEILARIKNQMQMERP